ncbi:MAG: universal stress protein [Anaerolineae bacterium]|nr:MAG: universal stress protein [Anaerolineae bacterium]
MYKKILVPLDGSDRAEAILPHVKDLATCYRAEVLFLQVIEPNVLYSSPYDAYPELNLAEYEDRTPEAEEYLKQLVDEYLADDLAANYRVKYGSVVLAILEIAEAENVDLIAMVSHGRTGLSRVFYGSVAAGVLHRIDRPLLLIRSQ